MTTGRLIGEKYTNAFIFYYYMPGGITGKNKVNTPSPAAQDGEN